MSFLRRDGLFRFCFAKDHDVVKFVIDLFVVVFDRGISDRFAGTWSSCAFRFLLCVVIYNYFHDRTNPTVFLLPPDNKGFNNIVTNEKDFPDGAKSIYSTSMTSTFSRLIAPPRSR